MVALLLVAVLLLATVLSMPIVKVIANIRGKKYDIAAETVDEFSQKVESISGLEASKQSVLFKGKVLGKSDKLFELGIVTGDVLNVLKVRKSRIVKPFGEVTRLGKKATPNHQKKIEGVSPEEYKRATKMIESFINSGGMGSEKAVEMMEYFANSDVLDELISNDEALEAARLEFLKKIDDFGELLPGGVSHQIAVLAGNPQKFREMLLEAKDMMKKILNTAKTDGISKSQHSEKSNR